MEKALQVLNALERDGVLGRYAIGGAMAATFYVEPILTFDLDVFRDARETTYGDTPTRVLGAEHLAAIALQTGRAKDRLRVRLFLDEAALDQARLAAILDRHALREKWTAWTA